jgi:hypothetical protein
MTTFQDGPAKGQTLLLRRAPYFLRVTVDATGKWDGLDQPDDNPMPAEMIHAYHLVREPGMCHIRATGGRGGFYPIAEYQMVTTQPELRDMETTDRWRAWCFANRPQK